MLIKKILNLKGVKTISRQAQSSISGGSFTCAYYNGETGEVTYRVTSGMAQVFLKNASDHWCCNSCATASWYSDFDAYMSPE